MTFELSPMRNKDLENVKVTFYLFVILDSDPEVHVDEKGCATYLFHFLTHQDGR